MAAAFVDDVAIVGGGPTGVAALCALVRQGAAQSIVILDPLPCGFGHVFGERCAADPLLLCNSSNELTWIDAANPDDFTDFLIERGWPVAGEDHVPRFLIGQYCRQRYLDALALAAAAGIRVRHVMQKGRTITLAGTGEAKTYRIALDDGASLQAANVLLCVGLDVPKLPTLLDGHQDHPRYIRGAYPARRLRDLPPGARVLVLGLRSSAQDAMLVLVRSGHLVTMTSPSGKLSSVRDVFRYPRRRYFAPDDVQNLDPADPDFNSRVVALMIAAMAAAGAGLAIDEQISREAGGIARLRHDLALAQAGKTRWADLIYEAINTINAVSGSWDQATRARIIPDAYEILSRFIASLPLLSGERLVEQIDAGTVTLSPVFVEALTPDDAGWTVLWQDGRQEHFDYVVSTSGYHFPRFPLVDRATLAISHAGSVKADTSLADIGVDLRIRLTQDLPPERIWALGAATNQRFRFAHLLWLAAQHAAHIAAEISPATATG